MDETKRGSCISRIKSLGRPSGSTGAISEFILSDPEAVLNLTIYEMAERVNTSVATISRFCNKIGYENYRSFQIDLMASLASNADSVSDDFHPADDPSTVIKRVFEINRQGLADTEKMIGEKSLIDVAILIVKAKRVFFIGVGGSGLIGRIGAMRFESQGITASAISDPYEGLFALSTATEKDVVIGVSHTGRSSVVTKLMKYVQERGARTVALTNYSDSPLSKMCEFTLLTSFRERRINAAVSSSRIAQMCVLDALHFLVAYHRSAKASKLAEQIETAAEELLREKT